CPQVVNLTGRPGQIGVNGIPGRNGESGPALRIGLGYVTGPRGELLILVRLDSDAGLLARTLVRPDAPALVVLLDGGAGGIGSSTARVWIYGTPVSVIPPSPGGNGGDGGSAELV